MQPENKGRIEKKVFHCLFPLFLPKNNETKQENRPEALKEEDLNMDEETAGSSSSHLYKASLL